MGCRVGEGVGEGGAEGGSVGRATCACPRHSLRPRHAYRWLIRAYVETGFRTPRLCIRRKYGFVRTRGARGCMNPPPPLNRPPIQPPPPHCCCCSCVGFRSRYPATPPTLSVILRTPSNLPTGFPSVSPRFIPRYPSQCTRPYPL